MMTEPASNQREPISFSDFLKIEMRIGTIIFADLNPKAKKPALWLKVDFGSLGVKESSAQLTEHYSPDRLIGKQVLAVVNFPSKNVAGIKSEVLILAGVSEKEGTVLLTPDRPMENGTRIS